MVLVIAKGTVGAVYSCCSFTRLKKSITEILQFYYLRSAAKLLCLKASISCFSFKPQTQQVRIAPNQRNHLRWITLYKITFSALTSPSLLFSPTLSLSAKASDTWHPFGSHSRSLSDDADIDSIEET